MNFFKEYGTTQEEILNTLTDAIDFIESNTTQYTDNGALPDRLAEVIAVLKIEWNIDD